MQEKSPDRRRVDAGECGGGERPRRTPETTKPAICSAGGGLAYGGDYSESEASSCCDFGSE
ncbi:hypothetical protein TPB0596_37010 [Tsukamurella pulmonis]|nr:hypothetical protein TPB0596_37010 [Tsukamurella pulmonis]